MVFCFSKTKVKTPKGIFDKLRHIQKIIILPTGLNNQVDNKGGEKKHRQSKTSAIKKEKNKTHTEEIIIFILKNQEVFFINMKTFVTNLGQIYQQNELRKRKDSKSGGLTEIYLTKNNKK